ncbi:hypothetical protein BGZ46_002383 [Entomortierella lignicola]|nr:hypothetical protein BGZ46_002383 [Entomortierella lignicola]
MSFIVRALKLDRMEPNRIVTSNLVSPKTLMIIRGLIFLYVLAATISVWVTSLDALDYFKYFTHLTYFGLMSYFLASTLWGYFYLRQPESERANWVKSGSPWWAYTHWLLYATVVTFSVIVPIVFWSLLASGISSWTPLEYYQNISEHALDGVFGALFEMTLNRHFLQPVHSFFVAAVMILYMFWAFVVYAATGGWVYPFLAWSQGPKAAIYYIAIAIALFIVYFVEYFIHKYRNKWLASYSIKINGDLDQEYEQYGEKDLEDNRSL